MKGRRIAGLLMCALALTIAACGGDDDEDAATDFTSAANDLCTEQAQEVAVTFRETGVSTASTPEEAQLLQAERSQARLDIREEYAPRFEALEPPTEFSEQWDQYLELSEEGRQLSADLIAASESGDLEEAARLSEESSAINDERVAVLEEIGGLDSCAAILPEEDVAEIEAAIETYETTNDPAQCTEVVTEDFVESQFGGVDRCEQFQEKLDPSDLATAIECEEVEGVAGVSAEATCTPEGGRFDGQTGDYQMFYEDGAWKLFEAAEAPE